MILLTAGRPDEDTLFAWSGGRLLFRAMNDRAAVEQLSALGLDEPRSLIAAARREGVVEIDHDLDLAA